MKKTLIIIAILLAAVVIWYFINKKTTKDQIKVDPEDLSFDQQVAIVVNLINTTPAWRDEVKKIADNLVLYDDKKSRRIVREIFSFGSYESKYKNPVPLDNMITHEAKRHLKLRGLKDIQDHPLDFKKYPRGVTKESDWLNGY